MRAPAIREPRGSGAAVDDGVDGKLLVRGVVEDDYRPSGSDEGAEVVGRKGVGIDDQRAGPEPLAALHGGSTIVSARHLGRLETRRHHEVERPVVTVEQHETLDRNSAQRVSQGEAATEMTQPHRGAHGGSERYAHGVAGGDVRHPSSDLMLLRDP